MEGVTGFESVEQAVVWAIDQLLSDIGSRHEKLRQQSVRNRWLRRAAMADQTWAMARIGIDWADRASPRSTRWSGTGTRPTSEGPPSIDDAQAKQWLRDSAIRGNRAAAYWASSLEPDPTLLSIAFGEGISDEALDRAQLCAVASRMAAICRDRGDDSADHWYRIAVEGPRWTDRGTESTWLQTVVDYSEWQHPRSEGSCAVLCRLVVDDAALEGPPDRARMAGDAHKPWRLDYELAIRNEIARAKTFSHLMTEHVYNYADDRLQLLLLASENAQFDLDVHRDLVTATLTGVHGAPLNLPVIEAAAWEIVELSVAKTIPAILRGIRCDREAARFEELVSGIDFWSYTALEEPVVEPTSFFEYYSFETFEVPAWMERDQIFSELEHILNSLLVSVGPPGEERDNYLASNEDRATQEILEWLCLTSSRSKYTTLSDNIWPTLSDNIWPSFHLLSGTATWLAMWLATSTPSPSGRDRVHTWTRNWATVSRLLVNAVRTLCVHQYGMVENAGPQGYRFRTALLRPLGEEIRAITAQIDEAAGPSRLPRKGGRHH